jgi:hypothetical protein
MVVAWMITLPSAAVVGALCGGSQTFSAAPCSARW